MARLSLSKTLEEALRSGAGRTWIEDCGGAWRITGSQLLAHSRSVGNYLSKLGRHETCIFYVEKGPLYYVLLAYALLNYKDFCPIDKVTPKIRVNEIAGALPKPLVLTDSQDVAQELKVLAPHLMIFCLTLEDIQKPNDESMLEEIPSRRASYYIATSGSTGTPKLVRVPHDHTVPFVEWAIKFYQIDESTRWAQFSSIGFDLSLVDFLSALCGGGILVSVSSRMDRLRPANAIHRGRITHWHSVPSMIPYFLNDTSSGDVAETCRVFTFCGEPLSLADAKGLAQRYPGCRIVNTYGPTEGTLFCSFFEFDLSDPATADWHSVPIGAPIPGWSFFLLGSDSHKRLIVISDNIADGYEGIASDRFTSVKLFEAQTRAFDTGDYFYVRDGQLFFSHRLDTMVKISGNRVDLGEIESIARDAGFQNAIALLVDNHVMLLAEGTILDIDSRISVMATRLPVHCIPREVKLVQEMPRTPNGKIDRLALRKSKGEL